MFYTTSLLNASIQIAGLIWLDETFAPTLLAKKVKRVKIQTMNQDLYTEYDQRDRYPRGVLQQLSFVLANFLGHKSLSKP